MQWHIDAGQNDDVAVNGRVALSVRIGGVVLAVCEPKIELPDLFNITSAEEYRQLAAEEAELAKADVTNESRAQHYAMAAYYTRLAEAKEKLANTREVLTRHACTDS